ncbi:MAG: aminopeptidase P family protein [Dysgonomonas mossii]|uniref:aminopeptidase P family protein n=1 Tax=Dysgonomonas mossii TaxID=163665 RepID=UPI001D32E9AC|nr:aminopeptidase P family protein [Dysgonomonas mossii]MBS5796245.1 aminopeptidase P family protein [Dysgonomonas mossii]MBS7110835.1 aminopeptidase P family protein [Dysgonomonas mossii]
MNINKRLAALREFMGEKGLHAFIIPSTDSHLSEYPASHWASREWISGFTGSAGTVVVTREKAGLWTDSRYFLQGAKELEGADIELFKEGLPSTPSIEEWLTTELGKGEYVGIDGTVYAAKEAMNLTHKLNMKGLHLISDYDPFSKIWNDRPEIPTNPIFVLPEKYAGEAAHKKITRICDAVEKNGAESLLVASLDTIAWIFNIRGNDVKCNPVAVSYAYVSKEETVLFINPKKLTSEISDYLKAEGVTIAEYDKVFDYVSKLKTPVCLDANKVTFKLYNTIPDGCRIIDMPSPADLMKSIKNDTEVQGIRNAMERDGVALVRFFMWLEKAVPGGNVTEIMIPEKLVEYRSQQKNFVGESFDTISGYGPNGAIVHYHVSNESSLPVKPEGLLLVDSGAQYFDGTTDITRTLAVGPLTDQMKKDYTMVLKGHINLATAIYPQGTRGSQLDILARKALWNEGLNYLHGTGHGIGHFLNVHEGPQNIRMNENPTTLQPGMVTSNEPGLYRAGQYGIRIENLIRTKHEMTTEFGDFYSFETLTLCPIDTTPIVKEMLTEKEIIWLNEYHKFVYDRLSPLLTEDEKQWLKEKTHEI